jgi:hypothetical protein
VKSSLVYTKEVHLIQKVFSVEKTAPLQNVRSGGPIDYENPIEQGTHQS